MIISRLSPLFITTIVSHIYDATLHDVSASYNNVMSVATQAV